MVDDKASELAFRLRFQAAVQDRVADLATVPTIRKAALRQAAVLRVQADLIEQGVPIDKASRGSPGAPAVRFDDKP